MNRAELKFLQGTQASALVFSGISISLPIHLDGYTQDTQVSPLVLSQIDDDLCAVAAGAMYVAQTAVDLGITAVVQDGGSEDAGKIADTYYSVASLAYALVIESQNVRDALSAQTITPADAAKTIAEYGARLWNPAVIVDGVSGNPFAPYLDPSAEIAPVEFLSSEAIAGTLARIGADSTLQTWLAASADSITKTVSIPTSLAPVADPFDPNLLKVLTTSEGQSDANLARQVAASNLALLNPLAMGSGDLMAPTQIQAHMFKNLVVAGANQVAAGLLPSFANGNVIALTRQRAGGAPCLISVGQMVLEDQTSPFSSICMTQSNFGVFVRAEFIPGSDQLVNPDDPYLYIAQMKVTWTAGQTQLGGGFPVRPFDIYCTRDQEGAFTITPPDPLGNVTTGEEVRTVLVEEGAPIVCVAFRGSTYLDRSYAGQFHATQRVTPRATSTVVMPTLATFTATLSSTATHTPVATSTATPTLAPTLTPRTLAALVNPGFESGFVGWSEDPATFQYGGESVAESGEAYSGQQSRKLFLRWGGSHIIQRIETDLPAGSHISLSAWVKMPSPGEQSNKWFTLELVAGGADGGSQSLFVDQMTALPDWSQLTVGPLTTNSQVVWVEVHAYTTKGDGSYQDFDKPVWVDDFQLSVQLP
ncbi:MAG: hypothetical protein AB1861_21840 [Cyanobacteriota bacterium]